MNSRRWCSTTIGCSLRRRCGRWGIFLRRKRAMSRDVGEAITAAMEHQACVDLRWRIWVETKVYYGRLIEACPLWWQRLSWCAVMAVLVGWRPPVWVPTEETR